MVSTHRGTRLSVFLAVAIAAMGGLAAQSMRIPLPWMVGPMMAMALARLFELGVNPPKGGRQAGQLMIAVAIGLFFTPQVLSDVAHLVPWMLPTGLLSILAGYISARVLMRLTGADMATAFFACVPGGAAEMVILGRRYGGDAEFVAMSQSLRMMLVVLVIPLSLTWAGEPVSVGAGSVGHAHVSILGLAALLGVNVAMSLLFRALSAPTPWMLAPLICTAALTASGVQFSALPPGFSPMGQALIGCAIGSQFNRSFLMRAPRLVAGILASTFVTLVLIALTALLIAWAIGLPAGTMILAMAPGGIAEMSVTAKVLGLGVPVVTAFHVFRLVVLLMSTSPAFRMGLYFSERVRRQQE